MAIGRYYKTEKEMLDFMREKIEERLRKLGVNTTISVKKNIIDSEWKAEVESTPFNTIPSLFANVYIKGSIDAEDFAEEDERDITTIYNVDLNYVWEGWRGGSNGTKLGTMSFVSTNRDNSIRMEDGLTI